ncbi:hypothetical protein Tco_1058497, partial [Tanacetum coccineum]
MEQPVIIAVSSCRVSKYQEYQVFASSATYYYLNPNIPEAAESRALRSTRENKKQISLKDDNGTESKQLQGYIIDTTTTAPITLFSLTADKVADHPCTELVEKYKPADPKKIPPEILVAQGKTGVFQFHLNTLGNLIDLTLDAVFDIKKQDQSIGSSAQEPGKGTPSSTSTTTTQSMEKQEETKKGKEKGTAEEEGTTPPSHSIITDATKKRRKKPREYKENQQKGPFLTNNLLNQRNRREIESSLTISTSTK